MQWEVLIYKWDFIFDYFFSCKYYGEIYALIIIDNETAYWENNVAQTRKKKVSYSIGNI